MAQLSNLLMEVNEPVVTTYNTLVQATTGYAAISIAGSSNVTLTEAQAAHAVIELTGNVTANINVVVPTKEKVYHFFLNYTGSTIITIKTSGGAGVALTQNVFVTLYCNGTDVVQSSTEITSTGITRLRNSGTPSAFQDSISLWAADTDGVAGESGLHVLTESGMKHVFGNRTGLGVTSGFSSEQLLIRPIDGEGGKVALQTYVTGVAGGAYRIQKARGTAASPTVVNAADTSGSLQYDVWARDAADTVNEWTSLARLRALVDAKDGQNRVGGKLELRVTPPVSASDVQVIALTSANIAMHVQSNGQQLNIPEPLTELTTIAAAATTTTTIQIPANSVVFGVSVRVTVAIPTATTFSVGVSGAATRYGTGISVAANTTNPGVNTPMLFYAAGGGILITPSATPGTNAGRVRVTIHYYTITPPTS